MNNKYWGCILIARGLQVFQRAKSYLHILSTSITHFQKLGLATLSNQHNHNISNGSNCKVNLICAKVTNNFSYINYKPINIPALLGLLND
jgi:hypothetical protein